MIPLKDNNPTHRTPILTIILIALNVGGYFLWQTRGDELQGAIRTFQYAAVPYNITHDADEGRAVMAVEEVQLTSRVRGRPSIQYLRISDDTKIPSNGRVAVYEQAVPAWVTLLLSMFMHGSFMHLFGNMMFLWIFGNNVEDATGGLRFLLFYLVTGLAASAGHVFSDHESIVPTIGASGAVSGILGGYLLLYPRARVLTLVPLPGFLTTMHLPAAVFLVIWLAMQFSGVFGGAGGVAWWAHIGGFVAGLVLIKPLESGEHKSRNAPAGFRSRGSDWR